MTSSLQGYVILLLYDVNRFHVAVGLYSKGLKKTSICGKNISDKLSYHIMTSSVICDKTDARRVIIIRITRMFLHLFVASNFSISFAQFNFRA